MKELSRNNVQMFLLRLSSSFAEVVSPYMQWVDNLIRFPLGGELAISSLRQSLWLLLHGCCTSPGGFCVESFCILHVRWSGEVILDVAVTSTPHIVSWCLWAPKSVFRLQSLLLMSVPFHLLSSHNWHQRLLPLWIEHQSLFCFTSSLFTILLP